MSTRAKMSLADIALQLRDEQLQARIVHYKADLETSPELDAVTAAVVAELKALQKAAGAAPPGRPPRADRAQVEIELISSLKQRLGRLFRAGRAHRTVERKIAEASKRFARLFFESELCERIRGTEGEQKTMRFGAQALYHVLARNHDFLSGSSSPSSTSRPRSWRTRRAASRTSPRSSATRSSARPCRSSTR